MAKRKIEPKQKTERTHEVEVISITKLLNTDYQSYARYTVYNRAIPSLSDGFKTVQRKAFWTANKHLKGDGIIKVAALGGYAIAESHYAHGDASINQAVITMTQTFKQSLPYFMPDGSFGTIYAPEAGAPRYISLYKADIFDLLFKDNDQLIEQTAEGDKIEPLYYLPIIPTVLVNSTSGIAVGYASSINNRNSLLVMDEVLKYVKTGKITQTDIMPYISGAVGEWYLRTLKSGEKKFEHHGLYEKVNVNTINVTGIPCGYTFKTFEAWLNTLVETGILTEWINRSGKKNGLKYELKLSREHQSIIKDENALKSTLKLVTRLDKENMTLLDVDGTIQKYELDSDIIKRFVDWRLPFVEIRRQNQMKEIQKLIQFNLDKLKFIKLVNAGKIKVKEFKTRKEAEAKLKEFDLPVELVDIKLYSISEEEIKRLEAKNIEHSKSLEALGKTTAKAMYIKDIQELINGVEKLGYVRETYKTIED